MGSAHTKMQGTLVVQPPPAKPLVPVSAKEVQLSLAHTKEGWLVSRFDNMSSTDKTDSSAACTTESGPDTRSSTESGIDAEEPIGPVVVTGTSVPDDIPDDGSTEDLTPSSTFSQAGIAATSITKMIRSRPRASQLSELGANCSEPVTVSFLDSSGETIALLSAEEGPSYRTCDRRAVTLYASEPPDVVESWDGRFDSWILQEGVGAIPSSTSSQMVECFTLWPSSRVASDPISRKVVEPRTRLGSIHWRVTAGSATSAIPRCSSCMLQTAS